MPVIGTPEGWAYSELIPILRQAKLRAPQSFEEVADLVAAGVDEVRPELDRLRGDERAVFRLRLRGDAADLFFNGAAGYRAAYCHSIEEGEAANRRIVDALLPQLMAHAHAFASRPTAWIEASLRAPAAKAWVWEKKLHALGFPWVELIEEITYPAWREAAAEWLRSSVDLPDLTGYPRCRNDDRLSSWGVRAPLTQWIEVKGAWMQAGAPTASQKPDRAKQIRNWGWT